MEVPVAENLSIVQQIKALDEQRSKLLETAKAEALAKANEAVEDFALTDLTTKPKAKAATVASAVRWVKRFKPPARFRRRLLGATAAPAGSRRIATISWA